MSAQIGRIQWSRLGITIYDASGSFVTRIENDRDRNFFADIIVAALKRVSEEQIRRKRFVSDAEPAEVVGAAV